MAHDQRRTYVLFTVLAVYIVLQFVWWAVLLVRKEETVARLSMEIAALGGDAPQVMDAPRAMRMIVGEGVVFLVIVLVVLYLTLRAIRRDLALARSQRNFLLAVTHELRSPIAAIKLQLQTLARPGLDGDVREELRMQAIRETDRLAMLTEKVLRTTRSEERGQELVLERLDIMAFLRDVLEVVTPQVAPGHTVLIEGPERCEVVTDPDRIRTILENLVENAAKYTPVGTTITVEVVGRREGWRLLVHDEGPGVEEGERERIFERFYRSGNEETRLARGTGLGLYIVKRTARELGGDACVKPRETRGSIFVVSFPKH